MTIYSYLFLSEIDHYVSGDPLEKQEEIFPRDFDFINRFGWIITFTGYLVVAVFLALITGSLLGRTVVTIMSFMATPVTLLSLFLRWLGISGLLGIIIVVFSPRMRVIFHNIKHCNVSPDHISIFLRSQFAFCHLITSFNDSQNILW